MAKLEYDGKIDLKEWTYDKQVRNTANNDWLLDYFHRYGNLANPVDEKSSEQKATNNDFVPTRDDKEKGYEPSLEFSILIADQKRKFMELIIDYLMTRMISGNTPGSNSLNSSLSTLPSSVVHIIGPGRSVDQIANYQATLRAMELKVPIIVKGLLLDEVNKKVCVPDLLIRRDLLPSFFHNFGRESLDEHFPPIVSGAITQPAPKSEQSDEFTSHFPLDQLRRASSNSGRTGQIEELDLDAEEIRLYSPNNDGEQKNSSELTINSNSSNINNISIGSNDGDGDANHHQLPYAVVHVRFAFLELSKKKYPRILGSKNGRYYEALINCQVRALRNCLKIPPSQSDKGYLLGRGWKCGKEHRNNNAMDLLGVVRCHLDSNGYTTLIRSDRWLKRLEEEGKNWKLLPKPSNKLLYPNLKNDQDFPWSAAKRKLAHELKELTTLWQVGYVHRNLCLKEGVTQYDDPRLTTEMMAMPEGKISSLLSQIMLVNRKPFNSVDSHNGSNLPNGATLTVLPAPTTSILIEPAVVSSAVGHPVALVIAPKKKFSLFKTVPKAAVLAAKIAAVENKIAAVTVTASSIDPDEKISVTQPALPIPPVLPLKFGTDHCWMLKKIKGIEFTVDYETKSSIDDPLVKFPYSFDTTMISMIGCCYEHPITKQLISIIFNTKAATKVEEARIIDEWINFMDNVTAKYKHVWSQDKRILAKSSKLVKGGKAAKVIKKRKFDTEGNANSEISSASDDDSSNNTSASGNCASEVSANGNGKSLAKFKCFHWSKAEKSFFETNYNSAIARHGRNDWASRILWADVHQLCKAEEFAIRGCFNLSLKSVAKALYKLGLISEIWLPSQIENGMRAMVALIRCAEEAATLAKPMDECVWMEQLKPYLYLDIRTVHSIVAYLRKYHL